MPDKPLWLSRLPDAIRTLETAADPWVDRSTLETVLRVGRRRAQQLLSAVAPRRVGTSLVASRADVVAYLRRMPGDALPGNDNRLDDVSLDEAFSPPDAASTEPLDAATSLSVDKTSRPLDKDIHFRQSSSTLRRLLQAKLPTFDTAAVDRLWQDCHNNVPDVSEDEVAALFELKLPQSQKRAIENPNGFLVRAVARSCTPAAVSALRQGRELPKEEAPVLFDMKDLEEILNDPHTPKHWREAMLQRLKEQS